MLVDAYELGASTAFPSKNLCVGEFAVGSSRQEHNISATASVAAATLTSGIGVTATTDMTDNPLMVVLLSHVTAAGEALKSGDLVCPTNGFKYGPWASVMRTAYRKYWVDKVVVVDDDGEEEEEEEQGAPPVMKMENEKKAKNANTKKADKANAGVSNANANAGGGMRMTTQLAAVCVVSDSSWEAFVRMDADAGCGALVLGLAGFVDPMPGQESLRFNAEVNQYLTVLRDAGDEWAARAEALPDGGATAIGIPISASHIPDGALLVAHVHDCALRFGLGPSIAMGASKVLCAAEIAVNCGAVRVSDWDAHMREWSTSIRSKLPTFGNSASDSATAVASA